MAAFSLANSFYFFELRFHGFAVLGQDYIGRGTFRGRSAWQLGRFLGLCGGGVRNGKDGSKADKRFENLHVGVG